MRGSHHIPSTTIVPRAQPPQGRLIARCEYASARSARRIARVPRRRTGALSPLAADFSSLAASSEPPQQEEAGCFPTGLEPRKKHSTTASGTASSRQGASRIIRLSPRRESRGRADSTASAAVVAVPAARSTPTTPFSQAGAAKTISAVMIKLPESIVAAAATSTGRTFPRSQGSAPCGCVGPTGTFGLARLIPLSSKGHLHLGFGRECRWPFRQPTFPPLPTCGRLPTPAWPLSAQTQRETRSRLPLRPSTTHSRGA